MLEKKVNVIWIPVTFLVGVMVAMAGTVLANRTRPAPIVIQPPPPTPTVAPTATPGPINVYVSGAVANPAVYQLPAGSIVEDAVLMAGDFSANAARNVVNLAQPLADGMQIFVPTEAEVAAEPATEPVVLADPAGATATDPAGDGDGNPGNAGGLVNINTATPAELDELPGVGPATAQKIIDHREENGPFAAIEDIMDVSGIGEAKFEQMRDLITVE